MIFIENDNTSPYFNHAAEEYMLKNFKDECFMLWRNIPCVLIGKNQNALSEINFEFVKKNNIPVVRRLSGGGAVFNDLGNFNFTFISNDTGKDFTDFKKFSRPVADALKSLGVNVEFSSRNDLTIDGKKFSGNAQYKYKKRILHHGTLLYSADMADLSSALNYRPIKFQDKSIKSVASRVTNISEHLKVKMSVTEFKDYLFNYVMEHTENAGLFQFSENDLKEINKIAENKFAAWEWNYGSSPKYNFSNEKKFPSGIVEVELFVEKGIINHARIYGDFFGEKDICEVENALRNIPHRSDSISEALKQFNISNYISGIGLNDLVELMF